MRLLLDTHTFYWMVSHPERLGAAALESLEDNSNELFLSAASLWEIATKHRIGKFPAGAVLISSLRTLLTEMKIQPLSISMEHATVAGSLEWEHRDPFDRMIAAQCIVEKLTLVSKDDAFRDVSAISLIW